MTGVDCQGVLSYYKVEGPDKVSLVRELQRKSDVRIIGDECHKLVKKEKAAGTFDTIQRKVLGEVHMQVRTNARGVQEASESGSEEQ